MKTIPCVVDFNSNCGLSPSAHSPNTRGTCVARVRLHITIEPGLTATSPISIGVVIDAGPTAQKAEEGMTRRPDDDAYVSMPSNQVTRLGARYSLETRRPVIDVIGTGIRIRETGTLVDRMYQVRAIMLSITEMLRIECCGYH